MRNSAYNPMASSLTRQAWEYQQTLIDMMGEGMDGLGQDAAAPVVATPAPARTRTTLKACGGLALLSAAAGLSVAKFGVVPTALGVLAGLWILNDQQ